MLSSTKRRRPVRCALGAVCAVVWVCAVLRLAAGEGGAAESVVVAGGWGLSLLPVHVSTAPRGRPSARAAGDRRSDGGVVPW